MVKGNLPSIQGEPDLQTGFSAIAFRIYGTICSLRRTICILYSLNCIQRTQNYVVCVTVRIYIESTQHTYNDKTSCISTLSQMLG